MSSVSRSADTRKQSETYPAVERRRVGYRPRIQLVTASARSNHVILFQRRILLTGWRAAACGSVGRMYCSGPHERKEVAQWRRSLDHRTPCELECRRVMFAC